MSKKVAIAVIHKEEGTVFSADDVVYHRFMEHTDLDQCQTLIENIEDNPIDPAVIKQALYNALPHDDVNKPAHYTDGKIEVIEFIEDKQLGFALGNTVKYISRAGKKDPSKLTEDLKKARWYLDREIQRLENLK